MIEIRSVMEKVFPKLVDICFILSFVVLVISSLVMLSSPYIGIMTVLPMLVGGGVGIIMSFGLIYLLLDIREAVQKNK